MVEAIQAPAASVLTAKPAYVKVFTQWVNDASTVPDDASPAML